ncbi:MAG: plasmid pRiA4b ORF-3 family protein [Acidimicrobiia bacterium]|nr:plasmid pRiA4b ORF-3 family protein [Acidimicrobiia bacterium]
MTIHQLTVSLLEVEPAVWRRIEVDSDTDLGTFAWLLNQAMGWEFTHLHFFEVDGRAYGPGAEDAPDDELDEASVTVADVLPSMGSALTWVYDLGDRWEHDVVVEDVLEPEDGASYPRCIDGARACPPEDAGGPHGYETLLEAIEDPDDPEAEELREWLGDDFDPEHFDAARRTAAMQTSRD